MSVSVNRPIQKFCPYSFSINITQFFFNQDKIKQHNNEYRRYINMRILKNVIIITHIKRYRSDTFVVFDKVKELVSYQILS